jgi:hypothetical protein
MLGDIRGAGGEMKSGVPRENLVGKFYTLVLIGSAKIELTTQRWGLCHGRDSTVRKLLLATTVTLGLAASAATANATLVYTVWSGPTVVDHAAVFPVPSQDLVASFSDPGNNPINFRDDAPQNTTPNSFADFFSAPVLAEFVAAGGDPNASMSTLDNGTNISTFIRITGSYSSTTAFTGLIDHDDGGQIFVDGNSTTGVGAIFVCGDGAENSELTETCNFPTGSHTFTILYTEDNGSPSILVASVPAPEPASLALLGVGVLGLGFVTAKRRTQI